MKRIAVLAMAAMALAFSGQVMAAGDAKNGETVAKQCVACHDLTNKKQNKVGPYLWGNFGAPAGKVEGFKFSEAHMGKAGTIVWDAATMDKYLANPREFIPGNKMAFAGIKADKDRADLIEFLKTLK